MVDVRLKSLDDRYGLEINSKCLDYVFTICRTSGQIETGGILIGHYTREHDWAIITRVAGPPPDSERGVSWFFRGVKGLQRRLQQLWSKESSYYLGEWHLHPGHSAVPSKADIRQMKRISQDESYKCPEPLLMLVGGRPEAWQLGVYVFPRGAQLVELVSPDRTGFRRT